MSIHETSIRETYNFGAIAWPGKDQGFGLIIRVVQDVTRYDPTLRKYHILAECESWDIKELLLKCLDLHRQHQPERWTTCRADPAADEFTQEIRNKYPDAYSFQHYPALFAIEHPGESPYSLLIPKIKELVVEGKKRLYLNGSKVESLPIRDDETATLALGTYPAIEALGFAIVEAEENTLPRSWMDPEDDDFDDEDGLGLDIPIMGQPGG